ncbi:MAG: hypothetical protein AAGI51_05820 [Pseudomonadota bacterium]
MSRRVATLVQAFARCERGAVSLDYVVLTAAVCLLTLAGSSGMMEPLTDFALTVGTGMIDTLAFDRFPNLFGE